MAACAVNTAAGASVYGIGVDLPAVAAFSHVVYHHCIMSTPVDSIMREGEEAWDLHPFKKQESCFASS